MGLATDRALNRRRNSPATGAWLALEALQLHVCHARHDRWRYRNSAAHFGRRSWPFRQAVAPAVGSRVRPWRSPIHRLPGRRGAAQSQDFARAADWYPEQAIMRTPLRALPLLLAALVAASVGLAGCSAGAAMCASSRISRLLRARSPSSSLCRPPRDPSLRSCVRCGHR